MNQPHNRLGTVIKLTTPTKINSPGIFFPNNEVKQSRGARGYSTKELRHRTHREEKQLTRAVRRGAERCCFVIGPAPDGRAG